MKIHIRMFSVMLLILTMLSYQSFALAVENNGQEPSESNTSTELELRNKQKLEEQKALAQEKYEQAKKKAQESLEQKKELAKAKTLEQKQKACQNVSSVLSEKLANRQNKATEFKSKLDGHLTKITNFVEKNNIKFSEYESLLSNVQNKAIDTQAQIDNLVQYQPKIDCSSAEKVPEIVSSFKESLVGTKDSLKAYQESIKTLLAAVKEQAKIQGLI